MKCAHTGKTRHRQWWQAMNHLKAIRATGQPTHQMRIYHCLACHSFHVGFRAITDGDRITELLRRDQFYREGHRVLEGSHDEA
jgi:hypothetical protein